MKDCVTHDNQGLGNSNKLGVAQTLNLMLQMKKVLYISLSHSNLKIEFGS